MADEQVSKVAVTPAQRYVLVVLSHAEGQKVKGQRSRAYRRFNRGFGLTGILDAVDDHKGDVNQALRISRAPALFTLTAENVDYALDLVEVERATAVDRTIGPLFDVLDDIKAKRAYEDPVGVDFDAATEDWAPQKPVPVEEQISAYLRAKGEIHAAELVDQGGWDKPGPNGASAPQGEDRHEA